jgi:DNA-binding transcriptional MerR regulator
MKHNLYSLGDVARQLGVAPHRIVYAHVNGKLEEPKQRIAGKRVYDHEDIAVIASFFGVATDQTEEGSDDA